MCFILNPTTSLFFMLLHNTCLLFSINIILFSFKFLFCFHNFASACNTFPLHLIVACPNVNIQLTQITDCFHLVNSPIYHKVSGTSSGGRSKSRTLGGRGSAKSRTRSKSPFRSFRWPKSKSPKSEGQSGRDAYSDDEDNVHRSTFGKTSMR